MPTELSRIPLMGVCIDAMTTEELHERILRSCNEESRALILNVNAHAFNLAAEQPWFEKTLNAADIVFCDGSGVRLAAWIAGYHIPERITYADWMWRFAGFSAEHGLSWFLLGGAPGRAAAAATELVKRAPGLRIIGTHHGYFDKAVGGNENADVIRLVNAASPDVLVVGFGMPLQESWYAENWPTLNARIGLAGGAVFDYLSGSLRRPLWIFRRFGMEWLGRLLIEPKRLWRRYLAGNPKFLARALAFGVKHRVRRRNN